MVAIWRLVEVQVGKFEVVVLPVGHVSVATRMLSAGIDQLEGLAGQKPVGKV